MKIISKIVDLQDYLEVVRLQNRVIGFVPTMGALHAGHTGLVDIGKQNGYFMVVSIFVNPTQFNNKEDLINYPRMLQSDLDALQGLADLVFIPEVDEMYPEPDTRVFDFGSAAMVMEGAFRPGHFNGVAQIVSKLFDAVKPDVAYFGEKDFQQLHIVRKLAAEFFPNINIVGCPIARENDGLAMSSRNLRLEPHHREIAGFIFKYLSESKQFVNNKPIPFIKDWIESNITKATGFKIEYVEIINGNNLQPIANWTDSNYIVVCIALWAGKIRLIDNIRYI